MGIEPHTQATVTGFERMCMIEPQVQRHDQIVAIAQVVQGLLLGEQVPGFVDQLVVLNDSLHRRAP